MPKISIRKAVLNDAAAIAALHIKTWQKIYRNIIPNNVLHHLSLEQRIQQWQKWLKKTTCTTFIAENNNKIIGFISFGSSRNDYNHANTAEIYAIYIDSHFWRQNIGTQLLLAAEQKIKREHYQNIILWVISENSSARKFYEKNDFSITTLLKINEILPEVNVTEIKYRKKLIY